MCTLIAGVRVLGAGTLVIGANRDESPARPSASPGVLRARPRVVGGRDLEAGGTWLAIREARFVTALLNRRPLADAVASGGAAGSGAPPLRSRGLLCLDAAAGPPADDAPHALDPATGERYPARRDAALRLLDRDPYGHCTLVGLGADGEAWSIHAGHGGAPEARALDPGWHVVTHVDPDDRSEPRTAWILDALRGYAPSGAEEALARLAGILRSHGEAGDGASGAGGAGDGGPPVCLHGPRFPTVSSTLVALGAPGGPRYHHAPGPPCVTPYEDVSVLLA
ncbi:MAG: NRDE family protein [Hyphomicrobiales bacterium]